MDAQKYELTIKQFSFVVRTWTIKLSFIDDIIMYKANSVYFGLFWFFLF